MRILLVEDESIIALNLKRQLQKMGHEILGVAPSGKKAIELAEATNPGLIIMDIRLQGPMDGITVGTRISPTIPIVYSSAFFDDDTLSRTKSTNFVGYLRKPYTLTDIQTLLENIPRP